jgi:secreted PhoX family phosphatase
MGSAGLVRRPTARPWVKADRPNNWGLFLRFWGDGESLDGPGNIAFDADGNAWVANNYEYSRTRGKPVCGGNLVAVFRPDGSYASFSPIVGGGISGSGYGITFDPDGNLWLSNFGFAAAPPGCPADQQPPHNSLSKFAPDGTILSGPNGITQGKLSWPQGTVSNKKGDIWIANCGPTTTRSARPSRTTVSRSTRAATRARRRRSATRTSTNLSTSHSTNAGQRSSAAP